MDAQSPDSADRTGQKEVDATPVLAADKAALRAALMPLRRAALDASPEVGERIATQVASWLSDKRYRVLAFYWPLDGEPDLRVTVARWLSADATRQAALPIVVRAGAPLQFAAWTPATAMRDGKYGIAVPADIVTVRPDALLIPCVGFDTRGYRLGYGGGFYDRTLAAFDATDMGDTTDTADTVTAAGTVTDADDATGADHRPSTGPARPAHPTRPATIGIALDATRQPPLPVAPFDIPLDVILTERAAYHAEPSRR